MLRPADSLGSDVGGRIWATLIAPRPIGFIVTVAEEGTPNIAPFNSFAGVSNYPPLVTVSISKRKGARKITAANIGSAGEFTINLVSSGMAVTMMEAAAGVAVQDDFLRLRLTPSAFELVQVPYIGECPAAIGCRLVQEVPLADSASTLWVGRVVELYIADKYVQNGVFDPIGADLLASVGAEDYIGLGGGRWRFPRTWE